MRTNNFTCSFPLRSRYRSNIYTIGELSKLIENLEAGMDNFKLTIVNQAAYFYILNPNDFSTPLMEDWLAVREQVGFADTSKMYCMESMKAQIRKKTEHFSEEDIGNLMVNLYDLKSKLLIELRK